MEEKRKMVWDILEEVNHILLGKEEIIRQAMAAILAGGHILMEDVPGVGKTTLARAFAKALGFASTRVQFTPDVLPSDLTGFSVYHKEKEQFIYHPGAVFCNLLLADEINRTSPKTQSALLEVMEERQVTVDGVTRKVPEPFVVIATQNPSGASGTQMLPEAQMDRFMVCMSLGYPDLESEIGMAKGLSGFAEERIRSRCSPEGFLVLRQSVLSTFIHDSVYEYIVRLVAATRKHRHLEHGASPRGTIALVRMAQAAAFLKGRDYVTPQEVQAQFPGVVRHRIALKVQAQMEHVGKEEVIREILQQVKKPELRRRKND